MVDLEIKATVRTTEMNLVNQEIDNNPIVTDCHDFPFGRSTEWDVFRENKKVRIRETHPFKKAKRVRYLSHWERSIEVEIEIAGDQWMDLWIAADTAVWAARDTHNRFIEDFKPDPEDPTVLILSTGS